MQSSTIGAFRKRVKKAGYTDISIKLSYPVTDKNNPLYDIWGTEPLSQRRVCQSYTITAMHHAFRFR